MSKAERLVSLVNLIMNRGVMHVHEMADQCDVNERTIYRDMTALSRMGIPIYYRNGYRIMPNSTSPVLSVSPLDLDILSLAVCNSPLSKSPYFRPRLKGIIEKLQMTKSKGTLPKEPPLVMYGRNAKTSPCKYEHTDVFHFLQAALERKRIEISGINGTTARRSCIPIAVKLVENGAQMVIASNEASAWEMVPMTTQVRVHPTRDSFERRPNQTC